MRSSSLHCYKFHPLLALTLIFLVVNCIAETPPPDYRQMAQLAEYVGVDYPEAVENGIIINDAEYQEMLEFSRILMAQAQNSESETLASRANNLRIAIQDKQSPDIIREFGSEMRRELFALMPASDQPSQLLPINEIQQIFQTSCATCHGTEGKGDGILSDHLEPSPTNFTNQERALNRSVLGLYDAITNGIEDTAMASYDQFTEEQRWSLAFYVGSLAFTDATIENKNFTKFSVKDLINQSPTQLANGDIGKKHEIVNLRARPQVLFSSIPSPLKTSRDLLLAARDSYGQGRFEESSRLAVSAYLDGFELVENSLDTYNPDLRKEIEANMMA